MPEGVIELSEGVLTKIEPGCTYGLVLTVPSGVDEMRQMRERFAEQTGAELIVFVVNGC